MTADEHLGEALRLLTSRGFERTNNRSGCRTFEGHLNCAKGAVPVRLEVSDWNFLKYPPIYLIGRPDSLPKLLPHVDGEGGLCYFAPGSVVLDRYNPADALAQCLKQATTVVDDIISDPEQRNRDVQDEFLAYWLLGQNPLPWPVLISNVEPSKDSAEYYILGAKGNRRAMISQNKVEVDRLAIALDIPVPAVSHAHCWLLKSDLYPAAPRDALPSNVRNLFDWLKSWDRKVYNGVQAVLEKNSDYLRNCFVTFAIHSPAGWLGFGFNLDLVHRQGYRKAPHRYKQYLHGKGGTQPIFRISMTEVGSEFIHSRNLKYPDLRNKWITLVGCGAIGGYLAQALVRLGAGTGEKGKLVLIDHDDLEPDNLGRHYLGFTGLFSPKADALHHALQLQFPYACIESRQERVVPNRHLFTGDLIVDATGEETVNEMINGHHIAFRPIVPPVLYVWIKGNGECTQALWVDDSAKFGCYRCLRIPNGHQYRKERFPVLKALPEQGFVGCSAFTPYAVSAPMQAAALAADMVIDWMKGDPSPRFRTRSVENADVYVVKNQNISALEGCPACSKH